METNEIQSGIYSTYAIDNTTNVDQNGCQFFCQQKAFAQKGRHGISEMTIGITRKSITPGYLYRVVLWHRSSFITCGLTTGGGWTNIVVIPIAVLVIIVIVVIAASIIVLRFQEWSQNGLSRRSIMNIIQTTQVIITGKKCNVKLDFLWLLVDASCICVLTVVDTLLLDLILLSQPFWDVVFSELTHNVLEGAFAQGSLFQHNLNPFQGNVVGRTEMLEKDISSVSICH